ncbi:hypothetical protein IDG70_04630, partial [Staphylococcus sp. EG-SA-26]|nr:hypothetical protein [Staphylococcus sp. EG-SA-26]
MSIKATSLWHFQITLSISKDLGYETNVENGRIFFEGDASAIVKANLWLRTADRIKIVVGRFNAT